MPLLSLFQRQLYRAQIKMSKEILHNAQAKLSWSGSMTTFPVDFLNPKSMTHCT